MEFSFGQYEGLTVDEVLEIDPKYCKWIVTKIEKRKPELYQEIIAKISEISEIDETPEIMPFGKYREWLIEEFIFDDKSYCEWLLNESTLGSEYPRTYQYLEKYFEQVYGSELDEIAYFYLLKFDNQEYIKPGITSNYIVKRIYSYTHTINLYMKDEIDYKGSFVYRTTNLNLEKMFLVNFKEHRVDKKSERVKIKMNVATMYVDELRKSDSSFEYFKKPLSDFIPYDYGSEFKRSFRAKINEFQKFRKVYEAHLLNSNLLKSYNPEFYGATKN
ncbi:MAG: hypothetical protein ABJQ69_03420 [Ekhidna sp.]